MSSPCWPQLAWSDCRRLPHGGFSPSLSQVSYSSVIPFLPWFSSKIHWSTCSHNFLLQLLAGEWGETWCLHSFCALLLVPVGPSDLVQHMQRAAGASVVLAPCHCSVSVMFRMMIISGYNLSLVQTFKPLIKIRERRVTFDTQWNDALDKNVQIAPVVSVLFFFFTCI